MQLDIPHIVQTVLAQYTLRPTGSHGVAHWARVYENGMRLAQVTGAKIEVVQLFALFHDSKREKEGTDRDHGPRGAEFAAQMRGQLFELDKRDFHLLYTACEGHTRQRTHPDVTVQTCWDADRLDLGRVGMIPDPLRLCTDAARDPAMLRWADGRAAIRFVPPLVKEWRVKLD